MKKIVCSLAALLLIAVMAVSCNKNSAKDTATVWLNGFYHMDYDAAKKVSTPETDTLLSQLQQLTASMTTDSNKKEMKKIVITVKDVKENGDKAVATYSISDVPGKDQTINLVKKDGRWLVQYTKNDTMGGAADNSADQGTGTDTTAPAADAAMSDTMKH